MNVYNRISAHFTLMSLCQFKNSQRNDYFAPALQTQPGVSYPDPLQKQQNPLPVVSKSVEDRFLKSYYPVSIILIKNLHLRS